MDSQESPSEAVREQLDRILRSSGFDRSPRLRRFLRYLVEESAAGRAQALKEYAIGVEVFDRGSAFDPRLDPIVRVEARRLRTRLADYYEADGRADPLVIQVPTGGYEAIVSPRGAATSAREPSPPEPEAEEDRPETVEPPARVATPRPGHAARTALRIATALLVLVLGLAVLWWRGRTAPAPAVARDRTSIAVLPLEPIGEDADLAAFSDGLTEDVITELARVRGLRVIARTSVNRFKQTRTPIRTIAADLGVDTVLEGSVRREGGALRITAQLIDGGSEQHLWAQSYDRTYADTLAIQGEVAREITRSLAVRLSPEEERRLLGSATSVRAAHEAYLRGVHHMSLRTPAEVQKAMGWLQQAVALDPHYGAARVRLAETYLFLALEGAGDPARLMQKTRQLASAALADDPQLGEAHRSLGLVLALHDRDWAAAERELKLAVAMTPGLAPSHEAMGAVLVPLGRFSEAVASQREAVAANPLSAPAVATLGGMVDRAGDEKEGLRLLQSALDLEPRFATGYVQLAKLHLRHGRPAEALKLLEQARELAPEASSWLGPLAITLAELGRRPEAEAVVREIEARAAAGRATAVSRAEAAMGLGRKDDAIAWLGRAADAHEPWVVFVGVDRLYRPLRGDARYEALLRRLGLKLSE